MSESFDGLGGDTRRRVWMSSLAVAVRPGESEKTVEKLVKILPLLATYAEARTTIATVSATDAAVCGETAAANSPHRSGLRRGGQPQAASSLLTMRERPPCLAA